MFFRELDLLETLSEKNEVRDAVSRGFWRANWWFVVPLWIGFVVAYSYACYYVVGIWLAPYYSMWITPEFAWKIVFATGSVAVAVFYQCIFQVPLVRRVRTELNRRGVRICVPCGHRLVEVTDRCPECGRQPTPLD